MKKCAWALAGVILMSGCASSLNYDPATELAPLSVSFADDEWDGVKVPTVGIARYFGGQGMSPPLIVSGIPVETNAVVLEFNDLDFPPLKEYGGHGAYFMYTKGKSEITIPAVSEQTFELPEGVYLEHRHRVNHEAVRGGAYLAPGSGGMEHRYMVDVKAVYKPADKKMRPRLLGIKSFLIGVY